MITTTSVLAVGRSALSLAQRLSPCPWPLGRSADEKHKHSRRDWRSGDTAPLTTDAADGTRDEYAEARRL